MSQLATIPQNMRIIHPPYGGESGRPPLALVKTYLGRNGAVLTPSHNAGQVLTKILGLSFGAHELSSSRWQGRKDPSLDEYAKIAFSSSSVAVEGIIIYNRPGKRLGSKVEDRKSGSVFRVPKIFRNAFAVIVPIPECTFSPKGGKFVIEASDNLSQVVRLPPNEFFLASDVSYKKPNLGILPSIDYHLIRDTGSVVSILAYLQKTIVSLPCSYDYFNFMLTRARREGTGSVGDPCASIFEDLLQAEIMATTGSRRGEPLEKGNAVLRFSFAPSYFGVILENARKINSQVNQKEVTALTALVGLLDNATVL
ncbi:MAG: hypothetical protein NT157_04625 [Candidatus Micrarchaeota archaeon]|nr:hypothetical protein [Candidatus Micrarchaeota archaeon]